MAGSVTIIAEVISIDRVDRVLALLGPGGKLVELRVSHEVGDLEHVELGDQVRVEYHEPVALLSRRQKGARKTTRRSRSASPAEENKGAGDVGEIVNGPATVETMDRNKRLVKLRTPDGKLFTTNVEEAVALFDSLKVGDSVQAQITGATAVSVEKL